MYLNHEFAKSNLEVRIADVTLKVNSDIYHLEAQMTKDENIVVRVFEYGFFIAMQERSEKMVLRFPEPMVIYLDEGMKVPETSQLILDFGNQGNFTYEVQNFLYQRHEIEELNQRKLILFIPFQLLKLRKMLTDHKTTITPELLQKLVGNDIMNSINKNCTVGNITEDDAGQLRELVSELYNHLCEHYEELRGYNNMKELLPGALELPGDPYRRRIDELEKEVEAEKQKVEAEKQKAEAENRELLARIKELEAQQKSNRK